MPTYDFEAGGKKISIDSPRALSPEEQQSIAAKSFGGSESKPEGTPEALGPAGKYVDPIANLPGVGGRLASLAQHIVAPKTAAEHAQSLAVSGPLFGLGRTAATALGAPAIAGPMAVGGAMGGAGSVARGEGSTSFGLHTVADALLTGLMEVGLGKLSQPSKAVAKKIEDAVSGNETARAAYEWAKRAPQEAMEAIKSRVPQTLRFFEVPAIGPKPMTLQDAVTGLGTLRGRDYEDALVQLKRQLNLLEFKPSIPRAGESFEKRVSQYIKDPVPAPIPKNPREAIGSDAARNVADALATHDVGGIPAGAVLPLMAPGGMGNLAKGALRALIP